MRKPTSKLQSKELLWASLPSWLRTIFAGAYRWDARSAATAAGGANRAVRAALLARSGASDQPPVYRAGRASAVRATGPGQASTSAYGRRA